MLIPRTRKNYTEPNHRTQHLHHQQTVPIPWILTSLNAGSCSLFRAVILGTASYFSINRHSTRMLYKGRQHKLTQVRDYIENNAYSIGKCINSLHEASMRILKHTRMSEVLQSEK